MGRVAAWDSVIHAGNSARHPSGPSTKVDQTRMDTAANDRNPTSRKRVMRVFDDDLVEVFAGGMSLA